MREFVLLSQSGAVMGIVCAGSRQWLSGRYPEYTVVPVEEVSLSKLERYRYWAERP